MVWIQIFSPEGLSVGHVWDWACTAVPHCPISHSNCIQRLGTPRDVFQYICYPIKSGGNFPIGHKNFKNYGSQVHHNYCCAPFIESSVALYCLPWMLLLGLLAILGYPWDWVSHFPMRHWNLVLRLLGVLGHLACSESVPFLAPWAPPAIYKPKRRLQGAIIY